ncbi:MAG TPA: delta-60 repeat domain-containing protein, partial [Pyrinomonadaceae bacterium]
MNRAAQSSFLLTLVARQTAAARWRWARYAALCALVAMLLVLSQRPHVAAVAVANDGDLDTTFGSGGRVATSFPGGLDTANDIAIQSDGKIVVAGSSSTDFALTRYNTDGSLDATFGNGGRVHTDFPVGQGGFASALVIQPDGKIVLAGLANDPSSSFASAFALARYNSNGSLDTTFGTGGLVLTPFPGNSAAANDIKLQPDGKFVVVGTATDNSTFNSVFAVARYNSDGALDTSFDTDGRATVDFTELTFEQAFAVALQTDGKMVVVGQGSSAFAVARLNANGALDTSFDTDGKTMTAFGGTFEEASDVVIQSDGKIVAVGQTARSVAADDNFALARYNTDGSLDTSFDTDGKVITDLGLVDAAEAVVLQPDGKIIAAGRAGTISGGSFFALARYNTNGSLDTSFDTDGFVLTDSGGGRFNLGALGVALQGDGKIVAAGDDNASSQRDFGVMRYNANGALDTSFDGDGIAITDFALNDDSVTALLTQADGRVVAVGRNDLRIRIVNTQNPNFQLARYNNDGSLDTTFGTGGIVTTNFSTDSDDFAFAGALQADGKIIAAGQTGAHFSQIPSADTSFALARYNSNGSLDTTFGTGGLVTVDFGTSHDSALGVAVQSDGKIVVVGTNFSDFLIARLNANGSLDTSFDTDGKVTTDFAGGSDSATAVLIQSDAKIVVAGSSAGDFALARYNADGSLDTSFDGDGKATTDFSGGADAISGLVRQSDGKLVAAGAATLPGTNSDFALARYNTNGSLDTSFDGDGKVTTDFGGFDSAQDLALQADGKLVAAGFYFPLAAAATQQALLTPRNAADDVTYYTADDATKSARHELTATMLNAQAAAAATGPFAFFAVARYNTNGALDSTFGTGGKVTTDFFGVDNQANAIAIQPDAKIVAAGYADTGSSRDFALARYLVSVPTAPLTVQFTGDNIPVTENAGRLDISVTLSAPAPTAVTVDYATSP